MGKCMYLHGKTLLIMRETFKGQDRKNIYYEDKINYKIS